LIYARPVVTLAGALMRGRHTAAILERMGVTETIANSPNDYVAIAVRLAREPSWRASLQRQIEANRDRVYRDDACIAALETFLNAAVRALPGAPNVAG